MTKERRGEAVITLLPHGRQLRVHPGANLLASLIAGNVFLRSDCGGRGKCGKCAVEVVAGDGGILLVEACTATVMEDIGLRIPMSSMMTSHIIDKAPVNLPASFTARASRSEAGGKSPLGLAVDLGTTTIAIYLCDLVSRRVIASLAVKNPQALHGDDVMSRIGQIGESKEKLCTLQHMVTGAIEWGAAELLDHAGRRSGEVERMVVVGNPTMIHILHGVLPASIGTAPYRPAFRSRRRAKAEALGFRSLPAMVDTLPHISGFLGGDILAAALAIELASQPVGTLLIDLGTNGEIMLKGRDGCFATSCATGPAFEGASISCGMQAVAGAVNRIWIPDPAGPPEYSVIENRVRGETRPLGICGSGIVSGVAAMVRAGLVAKSGLLLDRGDDATKTAAGTGGERRYVIVPAERTADGREIAISQKDIRAVQLGKGALISGIEFLLQEAGLEVLEKIIVAGAFGSYLDPADMITLGMVPALGHERIHFAGNSAGAGAIMALCDQGCFDRAADLAESVHVVELTASSDFQNIFIERLAFPACGG